MKICVYFYIRDIVCPYRKYSFHKKMLFPKKEHFAIDLKRALGYMKYQCHDRAEE